MRSGYSHYDMLWIAQDGECFYCGESMVPKTNHTPRAATKDHVFPVSRYPHRAGLQVWSCRGCNQAKGHRDPTFDEYIRAKVLELDRRKVQSNLDKKVAA